MNSIRAITLCGSTQYTGNVIHGKACQEYTENNPVLIFPSGDITFYETIAYTARANKGSLAIILEKGGPSCHAVINMREKKNIIVLHLPNAKKLLSEGSKVHIDAFKGEITIL